MPASSFKVVFLAIATAMQAYAVSSPVADCTTTLNITQTRFATPPYWPQCEFDSTMREYPSTTTTTTSLDCHGCRHIRVQEVPFVYCPYWHYTASTSETTPYTVHETVWQNRVINKLTRQYDAASDY
ncbi:hypothetical protein ISF_02366 [Cordyceps fumosorosea ARSEF 2679]|uniref:Uncharacterized protein n=1 Tax=Cordyceps fumosorosea (strain ARSEF 2679) TaxID=1081104 RepID=A0A162JKP8_CORFA|nr:hypothetical protein ISF_02366 [Cordyceps fumosorosea ARSEF 2679]OAA70392.1 hypothetical protein ISF_02366 [Cordyceps fumosorosea ARSEF 2679]